jgi:hypothetical protein
MRAALALLLVELAGCAAPEPYAFDPKVFLSRPMDEYQVNGTGFQMNFPRDGAGVQLPNALYLGGETTNAIAQGECPLESMVGLGAYPAAIATADTDYPRTSQEPITSGVRVLETGTAVMRIAVDYDVPFGCTSGLRRMIGTSTFTFFPSSRIVRYDNVTATDQDVGLSDCAPACPDNPTSWFFTSFWAFDTTTFEQPAGLEHPGGCAQIGSHQLAFAWMGEDPRTRVTTNGNNVTSAVLDFQFNTLQLTDDPGTATSVIQVGFDEQASVACAARHATISDAPLSIDERLVQLDAHGVYVDMLPHKGPISITAKNGAVAPFALLLDLGGARHARVSRDIGSYSIQEMTSTDNPDDFLFWFDDSISNFADPFTIEPY